MGTWRHGITSASHAEGLVLHMPSSRRVAPELRARIPAAFSRTSPLAQSLQTNVWHNHLIHNVAQALAITILKCSRHVD
jgi:hypothetical protein